MFKMVVKPVNFDIEDMGKPKSTLPTTEADAAKLKAVETISNSENVEGNAEDASSFDAWLKQRKMRWKTKRMERKRIRNGIVDTAGLAPMTIYLVARRIVHLV